METSFTTEIDIFGETGLLFKPNDLVPTRIEYDPDTPLSVNPNSVGDNFPVPDPFSLDGITDLEVSKMVIDTKTNEFQIAMKVNPDDSKFFLNKFNGVVTVKSVSLFVSCKPNN